MAKTHGFGAKWFAVILVDFVEIAHSRAGEADELPANHVGVSAVHRITEHALDRVSPEKRKEDSGFNFVQSFVLGGGGKEMKAPQARQTIAINLPRRGAPLVAEFAGGIFKWRLGVAKAVPAVRARKLTVDKNGHAGFSRAWVGVVGREYARCSRSDDEGFRFCKKTEGDTNQLMLGREESGFAVERINEDAPESRGGKREKMAAAHVRECNRGKRAQHARRGAQRSVV